MRSCWVIALVGLFVAAAATPGQIPKPTDAPRPLTPEASAKLVQLPRGFRLELIASEPLIREASGVCWDEQGRLYVCELHGYNLEGQYDIEELNRTGQLDRVVRRIPANPRAMAAAHKETYGTVKLLTDTDGDGRMDRATILADRLPPCYGICPARGGVIVACAPDIVYLADRDGDGKAEVREVLYTGFGTGPLERGINCPQWGPDDWIYVGRGHGGGKITGPRLKQSVQLPNTDFRIKADGTAIEPVSGGTHTIGHAFTEAGDRFVVTTRSPALYVPPLPWRYLTRNPDIAAPAMQLDINPDQRVYPISKPHPWRTRRAEDPGFEKYYRERYGIQESAPNGYFTSGCSPLVYQDSALPGLHGHLLGCEPAQNLVYRAILSREGVVPKLRRPPEEAKNEFLASGDPWFHPMALSQAPDGSVWIVDFYREIIEDYSAIPRYLQQQYGLVHGKDHGRIWRLTHADLPRASSPVMSELTAEQLARETASPYLWRRQTARRLLIERKEKSAAPVLTRLAREAKQTGPALNVLYTLEALGELKPEDASAALAHAEPSVRVHALRLAELFLDRAPMLLDQVLRRADDPDPVVLLQLALSLGESQDARVLPALAHLARRHGDIQWISAAILSSLPGRGGALLAELVREPADLGKARGLLEPICAGIAARRHSQELSEALVRMAGVQDPATQAACLRGLRSGFKAAVSVALSEQAHESLKRLASHSDADVRSGGEALIRLLRIEDPARRQARLAQAAGQLGHVQVAVEKQLAAVAELAAEDDPGLTATLLAAFATSTPQVREAILQAVFSRRERLPALLDAVERKQVLASSLGAVRRTALLESKDASLRERAAKLLQPPGGASEAVFRKYASALAGPRDLAQGEKVFRERCATCHQVQGLGVAVGPDLNAEFQRAEETILKDILAPSDVISPGYVTYLIQTNAGQVYTGILASESANSVTLRMAEGKEQTLLRKEIESIGTLPASLMPEDLLKILGPGEVANVIAWLRSPPTRLVLVDDDPGLAASLTEGKGTAAFVTNDRFSGLAALRITPPQRFSPKIKGWEYRIREKPAPGEYRYLRLAWKSDGATGVMLELANDGRWPDAKVPRFRYCAGPNTTGWQAIEVSPGVPRDWTVVTRDLWKDCGDCTITGIAPTAMGGAALFDRIELLRTLEPGSRPTREGKKRF